MRRSTFTWPPIIGSAGVDALFARSLKLAKVEFSCLEGAAAAAVRGESPAVALHECLRQQEPAAAMETAAALFAVLLGLLSTFIGDQLTARVLAGAWPQSSEPGEHAPEKREK